MLNSGMKNWNFHYETTESSDGNILMFKQVGFLPILKLQVKQAQQVQ